MAIINQKNKVKDLSQFEGDDLSFYCKRCKKFIKVNQIIRKKIDQNRTSVIFIYYCKKCNSYYFKFKTFQIEKD